MVRTRDGVYTLKRPTLWLREADPGGIVEVSGYQNRRLVRILDPISVEQFRRGQVPVGEPA